jgi:hypothetical protein
MEAFDSIIDGFAWIENQSLPPDDDEATWLAAEVVALSSSLKSLEEGR